MLTSVAQRRNGRLRRARSRASFAWEPGIPFALGSPSPTSHVPMLSPSSIAFLKRLLDAPAPSGFETVAARAWRTEAGTFADKVTTDVAGNSMAEVNSGGSPTIMLDGHIDEIGVIIQYICLLYTSPSPRD